MAITRSSELMRIEIIPLGDGGFPNLFLTYRDSFDDPDDASLPVSNTRSAVLVKASPEGVATDITGESQLVQDICAAVWTDD